MKEKALTELRLPDLWKEFKQNFYQSFWDEFEQYMKMIKKSYIEQALEEEICIYTNATNRYERTPQRLYRRNGYWKRFILLKDGSLQIRMPRLREKGFQSQIIPRYIRRQRQIDEVLKSIFLYGASTRLTAKALRPLFGQQLSAQTISNIAKSLDKELEAFHRRAITQKYLYLYLDAIVLKSKTGIESKKEFVLVAYGINIQGIREIIDFRVVNAESENKWTGFLQDLQIRGLSSDTLSLIVTDGNRGLDNAVDNVYPLVRRQRCWVHKMRNLRNYIKKKDEQECLSHARAIYNAKSRKEAKKRFEEFKDNWEAVYPKAVECIKKDWVTLTEFFNAPRQMWKKLRTTNVIDRAFREIRKRTRLMVCFNNVESIERIVYALISHLNEQWRRNPIYEFTQKY